ncbi:MAG: helix-turn-helix transcriptional regulator [Oscillibacter sp.]|nr:helix-turn-helix transcriptional regulator [Oscillibacter sp.]
MLDQPNNCSGARIRERRKALHLSQEQLAAKLQLAGLDATQNMISRVEAGLRVVPDFELPFFADAMGVSPLWLLEREERNAPPEE